VYHRIAGGSPDVSKRAQPVQDVAPDLRRAARLGEYDGPEGSEEGGVISDPIPDL
jgi:hypothetical protein